MAATLSKRLGLQLGKSWPAVVPAAIKRDIARTIQLAKTFVAAAQHRSQFLPPLSACALTISPLPIKWAPGKSRGQSDNGGVSWLFFAKLHTLLQSASRQPCRLQRPTGHLNRPRTRPRTRYLVPRRSHNGRAKSVDAIGIASAERRRISSACPGGPPIFLSRLTYTNLQAHSGEAFGRLEHLSGFFIKGFAGGGAITGGNLQDEDFPPVTFPYIPAPIATSATGGLPTRRWTLVGRGGQRASSSDFLRATFIISNA